MTRGEKSYTRLGCGAARRAATRQATEDADATSVYPKTTGQFEKMAHVSDSYIDAECNGDPSAAADDSPCYGWALDMAMGPAMLDADLTIDEAR
ncbi:hypothetical protein [Streptomyces sp. NPDC051776]|uniref:hypothetical protein n=1 Tax=Streptomyces sp. NPDC051776 TaxID=3155414 RepID=UPI0034433F50